MTRTIQQKGTSATARAYMTELKDLDESTRNEALRRVEELMAQGYQEILALPMAVTLAEEWAANGKSEDSGLPGPSQHVMYEPGKGWVVCADDGEEPNATYDRFEDALAHAHELATSNHSAFYVYDMDHNLIDKYEGYGGDIANGYHVIPWQDGWAIKTTGEEGAFERYDTKSAALDAARSRARAEESVLVVHYRDGRVQRTSDYHTP